MRTIALALALIGATAGALPAVAQDAAPAAAVSLRTGLMLVSGDGRRVGKIDRVVTNEAGQPVSAAVIFDSRFVYVPAATITTADGNRVTTSLTRAELRRLP